MSIILNKRYRSSRMGYAYLILRLFLSVIIFLVLRSLMYGADVMFLFLFPIAVATLGWIVILGVVYAGKYFKVYEDRLVMYSGFSAKETKIILFTKIKKVEIVDEMFKRTFYVRLNIWMNPQDTEMQSIIPDAVLLLSPQRAEELKNFIIKSNPNLKND